MPIEGGELKEVAQRFDSSSMAHVGRRRAVRTDSRDGSGWRRRKGEGRRWAGSKERECGPQGGCMPKCKRAVETILVFFQRLEFKSRVLNKSFLK
jgi:hypothetical protein